LQHAWRGFLTDSHEPSVSREQPAQLPTAPARRHTEIDLEGNGQSPEGADRYCVEAPAFDPGHDVRGRPCHRGYVPLPQPAPAPYGTNHVAHVDVRHRPSLRARACQPVSQPAA